MIGAIKSCKRGGGGAERQRMGEEALAREIKLEQERDIYDATSQALGPTARVITRV